MPVKAEEKKTYTAGEAAAIGILAPISVALIIAATFPLTLYGAWCDKLIWNWFAAPYFHLPQMNIWVAIGLASWVRLQTFSSKWVEGEKTSFWKGIALSISYHSAVLLVAYLVHRFTA